MGEKKNESFKFYLPANICPCLNILAVKLSSAIVALEVFSSAESFTQAICRPDWGHLRRIQIDGASGFFFLLGASFVVRKIYGC